MADVLPFRRRNPRVACRVPAAAAILLLGASCTTVPADRAETAVAEPTGPQPRIVRVEPARPKIELTEDLLYRILAAEFAVQRGQRDVSVGHYLELARATRDPKIVERAAQIAIYARNDAAAAEVAKIWVDLDPMNPDPHQVLAVMALRDGEPETALQHLRDILNYAQGELDQKLLLIANLLSREQDRGLVLGLMERLVADYEESPEALYAFAHVAARLGDFERSRQLLQRTLELAPENDNAVMSYISILQRQGEAGDALDWLERALESRPSGADFSLRMAYARLLTDARRFEDARRQFEILSEQTPNNVDVMYALGLLYLQANRMDDAEKQFRRLAGTSERADDASYYLGRITEEKKDYDTAAVWYQGVQRGENYFDAQVRHALVMGRLGRVDEARAHLKTVRTQGSQEQLLLVQAEAELLIEEKRYAEAMQVYEQGLDTGYNADLLYARAMLAERMDRLDILETDLRRILEEQPDHAQALNALGYTLADRTDRYEEAYELIKRALDLNPGDFYILDSMGWVLYRLGRMQEAIDYLRKALAIRADPEVAAHLGEVLWVTGDREAAREVWDTALKATPDDSSLLETIRRFNP